MKDHLIHTKPPEEPLIRILFGNAIKLLRSTRKRGTSPALKSSQIHSQMLKKWRFDEEEPTIIAQECCWCWQQVACPIRNWFFSDFMKAIRTCFHGSLHAWSWWQKLNSPVCIKFDFLPMQMWSCGAKDLKVRIRLHLWLHEPLYFIIPPCDHPSQQNLQTDQMEPFSGFNLQKSPLKEP